MQGFQQLTDSPQATKFLSPSYDRDVIVGTFGVIGLGLNSHESELGDLDGTEPNAVNGSTGDALV